ncbi:MAG: heme-binding protein [Geminicoccaceae bacterium]|nr:MAG: heme-binding protein [Geminicoccaceae bacterium]
MWWLAGGAGLVVLGAFGAWAYVKLTIETPAYAVAEREGRFELRDYPALRVAEVITQGPREQAVRDGFRPLARYIFAREREGDKIAMTAPVTQERVAQGASEWRVRFVMPSQYDLDDLPRPAFSDVRLVETQPARMAAIRFSGRWQDARMEQREAELRRWIEAQGLMTVGPPVYAYYDDPFTPGFMRRNEVLIEVAPPPAPALAAPAS